MQQTPRTPFALVHFLKQFITETYHSASLSLLPRTSNYLCLCMSANLT